MRWVRTMIAAGALTGLAACGSTAAGGAGQQAAASASRSAEPAAASASAGVSLCAAARKVDRAVASPSASRFRELLPGGITIRDVPSVRALAAALCALPPVPQGLRCPAAAGGSFRLVFAAGTRDFQPVHIQLSGCRRVTGVGPARSWARSPRFGRLLSRTVGGKGRLIPGMHPSSVPTP